MAVRMLLLSALLVGCAMVVCSTKVESTQDAMHYLRKYGYLPQSEDETYHVTEDVMKEAICHFQYVFDLVETCELDVETLAAMSMPRCGMPDVDKYSPGTRKPKRYVLAGTTWSKTDLTYRIDSVTPDILPKADVVKTLVEAWTYWTAVTPLTVTQVFDNAEADIKINFFSGDHGDGIPFDGKLGVLAHATTPGGDFTHFDEAEDWTIGTPEGINLLKVAVHEFGHNLGLAHSLVRTAIMGPSEVYRNPFHLDPDDIEGIRAIYGSETN